MPQVLFHNGKPLMIGSKVAIDPKCCCVTTITVNVTGIVDVCVTCGGAILKLDEFNVSFQLTSNGTNSWSIFLASWQSGNTFTGAGCTGTPTPHVFSGGSTVTLSGSTYTLKTWSVVNGTQCFDFIGSGPASGITNTLAYGGTATISSP